MSKKLKILFIPIDAIGHVMAAIGQAEVLIDSGHTVLFAINEQWKGRLANYGIEEVLLSQEDRPSDEDPAKRWSKLFAGGGAMKQGTPLETTINIRTKLMPIFSEDGKRLDKKVEQLLKDIKPDVVVMDQVMAVPSVSLSGIPWVLVCSFNPLMFLDDERTPPSGSGKHSFIFLFLNQSNNLNRTAF